MSAHPDLSRYLDSLPRAVSVVDPNLWADEPLDSPFAAAIVAVAAGHHVCDHPSVSAETTTTTTTTTPTPTPTPISTTNSLVSSILTALDSHAKATVKITDEMATSQLECDRLNCQLATLKAEIAVVTQQLTQRNLKRRKILDIIRKERAARISGGSSGIATVEEQELSAVAGSCSNNGSLVGQTQQHITSTKISDSSIDTDLPSAYASPSFHLDIKNIMIPLAEAVVYVENGYFFFNTLSVNQQQSSNTSSTTDSTTITTTTTASSLEFQQTQATVTLIPLREWETETSINSSSNRITLLDMLAFIASDGKFDTSIPKTLSSSSIECLAKLGITHHAHYQDLFNYICASVNYSMSHYSSLSPAASVEGGEGMDCDKKNEIEQVVRASSSFMNLIHVMHSNWKRQMDSE